MTAPDTRIPSDDQLAYLLPFWTDIDPADRDELARHARVRRFAAGDMVQGCGYGCTGVIFLRSGSLRAFMMSDQGKEITLFRVEEGECCVLAASCVLPQITFDLALSAERDSELIAIDPACFGRLAEREVHIEAFTYRQALERFSDCMWVMQQVLFMSFDRRLAVFLLDELARNGSPTLAITHDQIARHLGSAREVVTRMLRYFASEGLIALSRGRIEVVDRAGLRALV